MTGTGFERDTTPYPPDDGVSMRMMTMPVDRPGNPVPPRQAMRRDGTVCNLLATLGAAPPGPQDPEDRVSDWTQV
jgi:hypothetical protein